MSLAPGQRVDFVGHAAPLVDAFVDCRMKVDAGVEARYGRLVHRVGQTRKRARREAIVVCVVRVADIAPERDQCVDRGAGLARVRGRVVGNGGVGSNVPQVGSIWSWMYVMGGASYVYLDDHTAYTPSPTASPTRA